MKKVTVKFGDLNIGDKFTSKVNMYFNENGYVKAQDHVMVCGTYTNAFCLKHGTMVHFDNEDEVEVEAPLTFADIAVWERFEYNGNTCIKTSDYRARDLSGDDWRFNGDEEVQCV